MSRDFLSLTSELSMLKPELIQQLTAESARTGEAPEAIIARRGLLSAVELDIVQTLLRPHDIVPGYELLNVLGHGGMGVVYRAKQKTLDRTVAIKTILVSQMSNRSMAARFEQEARAVARLQHPHIIAAIDFGQHDGRLFFVMELVAGEDLESRIARTRPSNLRDDGIEALAWGIARQAASGLAHAAEQGIVHRDIKPANLLLVEPPAGFPLPPGMPLVKIADFGLAFLASTEAEAQTRLTAANTTVGSPHYIAPEQLSGATVDARADIYALGATVFHLLAGRPPYVGLSLTQIVTQKMTAEAVPLRAAREGVSDETNSLVAAMMAREPNDRIASYSELLNRIDELLWSSKQVTMTELPAGTQSPRGKSTHVIPASTNAAASTAATSTAAPMLAETTDLPLSPRVSDTKPLQATQVFGQPPPLARDEPPVGPRVSRRAWFALAGGTLASGVGLWIWSNRRRPAVRLRPQLRSTGWSEPLFDGRSLKNWQPRSGTWILVDDEDGAKVLSGNNGVIARRLSRGDTQPTRPLLHFAISLAARLHQANAVEVHFGLVRDAGDNGPRFALRMEKESAWLATRAADRGSSEPRTTPISLPVATSPDQPRVLRLFRDATHWFVLVDEQLIGTLPLSGSPELAEFRLLAESGPAWFSDLEVEELAAPNTDGKAGTQINLQRQPL
ncbi:MAG: serine/threonine-protein kinase [Planctomycetaceae bacterium]